MKVDLIMPKLGESLQEGTIIKWLKQPGDKIERDEMILEISTDKVDTEVPSPVEGVMAEILASENETVEVGKVIAYIETEAGGAASKAPAKKAEVTPQAPPASKPAPVAEVPAPSQASSQQAYSSDLLDIIMPKLGESLQEGTIIKWLKKPGEKVERDEMILEISTDKVDTEVPSPVEGILVEILAQENQTVEVGTVIAKVSAGGLVPQTAKAEVKTEKTVSASVPENKATVAPAQEFISGTTKEIPARFDNKFFSPLVRTIAEAEGVSLEELMSLHGSGVDGRINKSDLLAYIEKKKTSGAKATVPMAKPITQPAVIPDSKPVQQPVMAVAQQGEDDEVIPMDRIRQLIAEHMVYSKHTSAHVTSVAEADVTEIVKLRKAKSGEFQSTEGFKLTFTPFFCKAVINAVKVHPMVNVSVDGKTIIRHKRINFGVATALDDGNLIVPVIKNSDALSLTGLARSVYDLSTRARTKKLNPDDIQGGTITLTNVGTFGTLFGTPVINQPQCAIIGVGAIKKRPVVMEIDGQQVIAIRDMMYVSITYDHRVIDGMLAGKCLAEIVQNMESMNAETVVF